MKCFADKNPGLGESKNSNKKKCKVFNPETLYTGKTIWPSVSKRENICNAEKTYFH